jgi:hypothetical protein
MLQVVRPPVDFVPTRDYLLLRPVENDLFVPNETAKLQRFRVVAAGEGYHTEYGFYETTTRVPGDIVYAPTTAAQIVIDGVDYVLCRERDLIGAPLPPETCDAVGD